MSYVDTIKAIEHAKLAAARRAVEALRSGCAPVIRQATNVYLGTFLRLPFNGWLSDQITDRLIAVVQEFCDFLLEDIALQDDLVEWLGSPDALRGAADALLADVDGPANDLRLEIKQSVLPGRYSWDDQPPSALYGTAADGQPDELERLLPFIEKLREILREMANSIETYYIELGVAIAGLVGAIAGAVVTLGAGVTVVGIPVAIATAIATVVSLAAAIGAIISLVVTASQVQGDLLDSAKSSFTYTWANYGEFAEVQ